MNKEKILGKPAEWDQVTAKTMGYVLNQLSGNPWNDGVFSRLSVTVSKILPQDRNIFAKYTYKETDVQYLLPPYEFWAVDLKVKFSIPYACLGQLNILPDL